MRKPFTQKNRLWEERYFFFDRHYEGDNTIVLENNNNNYNPGFNNFCSASNSGGYNITRYGIRNAIIIMTGTTSYLVQENNNLNYNPGLNNVGSENYTTGWNKNIVNTIALTISLDFQDDTYSTYLGWYSREFNWTFVDSPASYIE